MRNYLTREEILHLVEMERQRRARIANLIGLLLMTIITALAIFSGGGM